MMPRKTEAVRLPAVVAALFVLTLIVGVSVSSARGATPLDSQLSVTNVDPEGQGMSTLTVFYHLPQQVQVGANFTVPIKLYVDNLTDLMSFLLDYSVQVSLTLNNGRVISGQAGVNSSQTSENLGALQLHAGEGWGPVNITMPLTQTSTGLAVGQQTLANATMRINADVWFNQPVNYFRSEGSQSNLGDVLISNGTPAGPQPNYPGFVLLTLGAILLAVTLVTRPEKLSSREGDEAMPKKAPGSV